MEHQNLLDADFLSRQHTVFCEVFDEISLLDKEVYRGPRSEALKAALETATYLKVVSSGSPPGRYANLLKAFGDHLNEARSKLATRWYLDSYIDMLEKHLGNGVVRGLPEWVRLIEFQAENDP